MKIFYPRFTSFFCLLLTGFLVTVLAFSGAGKETDYDIKAEIKPEAKVVKGTEVVQFKNPSGKAIEKVVFLLRGNLYRQKNPYLSEIQIDKRYPGGFDPGWTKIQSVKGRNGEDLEYSFESLPPALQTYSLDRTVLKVFFEEPLEPEGKGWVKIEFKTKFSRKSTGDEEFYKDVFTWRFGWNPILAPENWWDEGKKSYWNQFELPAADYSGEFLLPENWNMVGANSEEKDEEKKTVTVKLNSARSLPLIASNRFEVYEADFRNIELDVYHFAGYEEQAKVLASYAQDAVKYYSSRYGGLTCEDLALVQSPVSGMFGMAADGLLVLGDSLLSEKELLLSSISDRLTDYLIAHEVAHQWFGIGVGVDFNAQNWISEAFAEYLAVDYFENKYGAEGPNLFQFPRSGLIRNLIESQLGFMNLRKHQFELPYIQNFQKGFDEAVIKPMSEAKYAQVTNTRIYKKGYLVLRSLRSFLKPTDMTSFLTKLYEQKVDKLADVEDLQRIAEKVSGENLDKYFEDWLYTGRYLDLSVKNITNAKKGSRYENKIYLRKEGGLPSPKVKITMTTPEEKEISRKIRIDKGEKIIQVSTENPVSKASIDPEDRVMDVDRINNHYPRKIELAVGKNKLPLDAYLLQLSSGGIRGSSVGKFNWLIGPGYIRGQYNKGRDLTLAGNMALQGNNFSQLNFQGSLMGRLKLWSHPPTGSPGKYWEQSGNLDISLNRSVTGTGEQLHYLRTELSVKERITSTRNIEVGAILGAGGYGTLEFKTSEKIKLLPRIYLSGEANLGLSGGGVPETLKPGLDQLKSFGFYREGGLLGREWIPLRFPGNFKLSSTLNLEVVMARDKNYFLGNLAMIEDITESFWITGGETWDSLEEIGFNSLKAEVGTKLSLNLKTLGGLLPIKLSLGYAYHGAGTGKQFFGIEMNV